VIERVTFHNDESGFCVLRVKARGQRDETTVIGSLPSVTAGEWLSAEGWSLARTRGAATDFALACMRLCGRTRSQCAGSRTGVCASQRSGSGLACEHEVWRGQ